MKLHSAGCDLWELNKYWGALMTIWGIRLQLYMDIILKVREELNCISYIPNESVWAG
jgi:hypothetical protein